MQATNEKSDDEHETLLSNPTRSEQKSPPSSPDQPSQRGKQMKKKNPHLEALKQQLRKMTEKKWYIGVFLIATVFTLFADDIRILSMPKEADAVVQGLMFTTLILFGAELFMLMWIEPGYSFGFFFWLDLVAVISIVPDVPWLSALILGLFGYDQNSMQELSVTRTSRAAKVGSRAGRLARLLRLVRLLRIMRVFRLFKFMAKKKKKRRNIKDMQMEMSADVVDTISKRMVVVVLLVVFTCFLLANSEFDLAAINSLIMLDEYDQLYNMSSRTTEFQAGYNATFTYSCSDYIDQQSLTLVFLQVQYKKVFPSPSVPGYCCQDPATGNPINLDDLRLEELYKLSVSGSSIVYLDRRSELHIAAILNIIVILLICIILVSASFDFSKVALQLIKAPIERLVVAKQAMEAILVVFSAVTRDGTNIDQQMDTITSACCKAVDAERVNLFFVDKVAQTLYCRSSGMLDLAEIMELDEEEQEEMRKKKKKDKILRHAGLMKQASTAFVSNASGQIQKRSSQLIGGISKQSILDGRDAADSSSKWGKLKQIVADKDHNRVQYTARIGHGVLGKVASTGEPANLKDASGEEYPLDPGYPLKTMLVMSVKNPADGECLAVVQAINKTFEGSFTNEDEQIMTKFCLQIASLIKRKTLEAMYHNATGEGGDAELRDLLGMFAGKGASTADEAADVRSVHESANDKSGVKHKQSVVAAPEVIDIVDKARSNFDHVKSWDFDVMEESRDVLLGYVHTIFGELGLMRAFKISDARLHAFCSEASNRYHDEVPYHNFFHAWAVLHACYMTVMTTAVIDSITLEDTLGLFVGAICHDAGHKGTNNAFHIACHHNDTMIPGLALRYNDVSVLENYHAYQCFNIIQASPDNDIFKSLSPEQFMEVREIIIQAILGTDMVHHTTLTAEFQDKQAFLLDVKEDRQLLVNTIMHANDLSNQCLPQKIAVKWALRVANEFKSQALAEQKAGLPVTGFMDIQGRLNVVNVDVAKLNFNFISYVVEPLWATYVDFFPELQPLLDNLRNNRDFWKGTVARVQAGTHKILL